MEEESTEGFTSISGSPQLQFKMLEELFNLAVALVSVAITLLDPMLQLANGVVIYILTPFSFHKKIDTGGPLHGGVAQLPSDGDVSSDGG